MSGSLSGYLKEGDSKALARIDEILARSRRVVEESMELSKRSVEQKIKIDNALETSQSTENSYLFPRRVNSKVLELSEYNEAEESLSQNYEKALEEVNSKIKVLEEKADEDEKLLEGLRKKVKNSREINLPSGSMMEYEILQADKLIRNLKETLAIGLAEENQKLKKDLESLLKKKSAEDSKLTKELEDIIKEKKNLEMQYNNLKYLHDHTTEHSEELEYAKQQLLRLEKDSRETIELLENKIEEQEMENRRLRAIGKNGSNAEKASIMKVKFQEQPDYSIRPPKKNRK